MPEYPIAVPISRIASAPTASRQHAEQGADFGVDERQALRGAVARDLIERRVAGAVQAAEVTLDGVWNDLAHNEIRILHAPDQNRRDSRAGVAIPTRCSTR